MDRVARTAGFASALVTGVVVVWCERASRRGSAGRLGTGITNPEAIERYLVARLSARTLRPAEYASRMAAVAAAAERLAADEETTCTTTSGRHRRTLLTRLGAALSVCRRRGRVARRSQLAGHAVTA